MADEETTPAEETDESEGGTAVATGESDAAEAGTTQDSAAQVHPVEFPNVSAAPLAGAARVPLQRFYDVSVDVSVELGRVTLPLGDLLKLGTGSVLELSRPLSEPVDVMAQGVRLARGDVVVVEDRYAVRITEIENAEADSHAEPIDVPATSVTAAQE